jgi:protein O-GlcNAc transferase
MAGNANDLFRRALAALQAGKAEEAERSFTELLKAQPRHVAGLNLIGVLLSRLGRFQEAEPYVRRALDEGPASDATLYNYGVVLKALKRPEEALDRFSQAIAINASVADTWNNRGTVYNDLKRYGEAVADFDKATSLNPVNPDAYCNKGKSLAALQLHDQSLSAFDSALTLKSDLAEAWLGRGNALVALRRHADALPAYDRALALKPNLAEAWFGRGNVLFQAKNYGDALAALDRAFTIRPDLESVQGARVFTKLLMCDWTNFDEEIPHLLSAVRSERLAAVPFALLLLQSSLADRLQCARRYGADWPPFRNLSSGRSYSHDRIRVAYLSSDFRDHPMAYLTAGLFEQHDKSRFEITALSCGPDQKSDARDRIEAAVENFVDVRSKSDEEIAELVRHLEIDISIDLMGFTEGYRFNIFARRPAPVQVSYLGFPGTMGSGCIDYILADRTVIPDDDRQFYTEKVVWLPDTYWVNDDRKPITDRQFTRRELGLPEDAFVFCCFNNSFKITPEIFSVWMRLLRVNDGSVLWLLAANQLAIANLRHEAQQRGVSPDRLIFAPRMPQADHLARHRCADLFVDTLPYNAHTTASDALWAGLPVVTCLGSTFAGRVAGSLLKAVGLPELITTSLEDYEALALAIAHDPSSLAALKEKLARNRATYPLFDTKRFTRRIESAYTAMWERQQSGEAPKAISVDPID